MIELFVGISLTLMRQSTIKSLCQMSAHLFYVIFETLCVTVVYGPLGSGEPFESKFTSQTCLRLLAVMM